VRAILLAVAVAGAAGVTALALGDRTVLARPPEAVVEAFVRALDAERPAQSLALLSEESAGRTSARELEQAWRRIEARLGSVRNVTGARVWAGRTHADAAAEVESSTGARVRLTFPLVWSGGEWRISDPGPLLDSGSQPTRPRP
jgi:hypothetical protein